MDAEEEMAEGIMRESSCLRPLTELRAELLSAGLGIPSALAGEAESPLMLVWSLLFISAAAHALTAATIRLFVVAKAGGTINGMTKPPVKTNPAPTGTVAVADEEDDAGTGN